MRYVVFAIALVVGSGLAAAQEEETLVGALVMPRLAWQPKIGKRQVDLGAEVPPYHVRCQEGKWLWIGRAWVKDSDVILVDLAVDYYSEYIRRNPCRAEAYYLRAVARVQMAACDESLLPASKQAAADLDRAVALSPCHADAIAKRAYLLVFDEFERAQAKMQTPDVDFDYDIETDGIAGPRFDRRVLSRAWRLFDRALRVRPKCASAYVLRSQCRTILGDQDGGLADLDRAVEVDPLYAAAWTQRGDTLEYLGRRDDAIASYGRAIALDPWDDDALGQRARLLAEAGKPEAALADLNRAIRHVRSDWFFQQRGHAWLEIGNADKATEDFAQAIRLDVGNAELLIEISETDPDVHLHEVQPTALFKLQLARRFTEESLHAWLIEDDSLRAIQSARKAMLLVSDFAPAHNAAGVALLWEGKLEEANEHLTRAIEFDPNYQVALVNRAILRAALGRIDDARNDLKRASEGSGERELLSEIAAWLDELAADKDARIATRPEEVIRGLRRGMSGFDSKPDATGVSRSIMVNGRLTR